MGLYADDGSINVTVVDGEDITGSQAPDGSWYVVIADGENYVGATHPCGAKWVTPTLENTLRIQADDGSLYVTDDPDVTGPQLVTVIDGDLFPEE